MSKISHQVESIRFRSMAFILMIRDSDDSKNCQIVTPIFNANKYESEITQVSNMLAKYLEESQAN